MHAIWPTTAATNNQVEILNEAKLLKFPTEGSPDLIDNNFLSCLERFWVSSLQLLPNEAKLKYSLQISQRDQCQAKGPGKGFLNVGRLKSVIQPNTY